MIHHPGMPVPPSTPPTSTPSITVVVVNWNRRNLAEACLQSLAGQTHPSFEVVVVDNGSTDKSLELFLELQHQYPVRFRLIRNTNNVGFCAANNQGFAASRSEFVALLRLAHCP
jgi:glycosyltransferase involved in cell wall biosynthesis